MAYGCSAATQGGQGLGVVPLASAATGLVTRAASSVFGKLFANPKDRERADRADQLYQAAVNGDVHAELTLRCLAGIRTPEVATFDASVLSDGSNCGFATAPARDYAMRLVQQLDGRNAPGSPGGPPRLAGLPFSPLMLLLGAGLVVAVIARPRRG